MGHRGTLPAPTLPQAPLLVEVRSAAWPGRSPSSGLVALDTRGLRALPVAVAFSFEGPELCPLAQVVVLRGQDI